jgi:ribosomal protein L7/L12
MGMAEDIAHIRFQIERMATTTDMSDQLDSIQDKLRHDIEPKLDKALNDKTPATEDDTTPSQKLTHIRFAILYATSEREPEAIKRLRQATGADLREAKETAEWIEQRMNGMVEQLKNKEAE